MTSTAAAQSQFEDFGEFITVSNQSSPLMKGGSGERTFEGSANKSNGGMSPGTLDLGPVTSATFPGQNSGLSSQHGSDKTAQYADMMAMGAILSAFDSALSQMKLQVAELCTIHSLEEEKLDNEVAKLEGGAAEDALAHLGYTVFQFLERTKTVGNTMSKLAGGLNKPGTSFTSFRQSRFTNASSWRGEWTTTQHKGSGLGFGEFTAASALNDSPGQHSLDNFRGDQSVASLAFTDAAETKDAAISRDEDGNKLINNYQVIGELGRGSFGKVKLAVHRETDVPYAVKILNKSLLRKARTGMISAFDQVRAEIAIMKKLKHKNIVRLYEVIDDPNSNKLYLVMQYIEEGSLLDIDAKSGTCEAVNEETVKSYTRQLISGLHYLHRHNVIHRDIKPDNILKGQDGTLYLSDFGVSEIVDEEEGELVGQQGTPTFFSPELCRGEGAVHGKAVDVWALGVTLYALLLGRMPFFGDTMDEVMHKIQNNSLDFPDGTPDLWKQVLSGLLNKDPKKRMSLLELKQHEWLTGSKTAPARSRKMSVFDVVTVDDKDLNNAISVGNNVRLTAHATPRERMGKFVRKIRDRVRSGSEDSTAFDGARSAEFGGASSIPTLKSTQSPHSTWGGSGSNIPIPPAGDAPPVKGRSRASTVTFEDSVEGGHEGMAHNLAKTTPRASSLDACSASPSPSKPVHVPSPSRDNLLPSSPTPQLNNFVAFGE